MNKKLILFINCSFFVFFTMFSLRVRHCFVSDLKSAESNTRKIPYSLLYQEIEEKSVLIFLSDELMKAFWFLPLGKEIKIGAKGCANNHLISLSTCCLPDSFLTLGEFNEIRKWGYVTGCLRGSYQCNKWEDLNRVLKPLWYQDFKITTLASHHSKDILAFGSSTGDVGMLYNGELYYFGNEGRKSAIDAICWNHKNQNLFATLCNGGEVKIWNCKNFSCLVSFTAADIGGKDLDIVCIDWNHQNANVLALCLSNGDVMVYDWTENRNLKYLEHNADGSEKTSIYKVGWHPACESVLVTASSETIKLWDYKTNTGGELFYRIRLYSGRFEISDFVWQKKKPFSLVVGDSKGRIKLVKLILG